MLYIRRISAVPFFPRGAAMEELIKYFAKLMKEKFYGSVEVKFEAGRITIIRVNRTMKPEDLR